MVKALDYYFKFKGVNTNISKTQFTEACQKYARDAMIEFLTERINGFEIIHIDKKTAFNTPHFQTLRGDLVTIEKEALMAALKEYFNNSLK